MIFLGLTTIAVAQQPAQYSLYNLNKFAFNPAYAGLDNSLSLTGVYRSQWVGLEGNPVTQHLNAHMPLYIAGGAAGLALENETLGSWKQTSFSASYAYQMPVGKTGLLSLGGSAGWVQRQLNGSKVRTPGTEVDDLGNPISHNDPSLSINTEAGAGSTAHAGVFFQGEKLEAGVSAMNLLGNKLDISSLKFQQERTYFLYLGYKLDLSKSLTATPSVLLKSDGYQTQIDFSVLARYNENIFVGASFRGYHANSIDAVALMGGFKLSEKISIGYAYDLGLSNLRSVNSGSHEVLLNYNLGKPIGKGRPPVIIYNPRSL
ncbi:MAG: type IX secretion system membrane protein PorP/SprF [Bacteroidetes bacterium]|nr:type IX secretion system membrane protein PorP/SprF [Bacteroidota bacterium]